MRHIHESWVSSVYNLTDSGTISDSIYNSNPEKTKKIVTIEFASAIEPNLYSLEAHYGGGNVVTASPETDQKKRHAEIYNSGSKVAEFESPSKPGTMIPSLLLTHADRSVDVTEWNPPWWTSLPAYGPAGRALHLDGIAYITLADASGIDLGGADPFSMAFWIKMPGPGNPDSSIISKADAARQQGITIWGNPYGGISLRMEDGVQSQITVNTFSGVADGRWHHVVFTYDGSGNRGGLDAYVDGQVDNLRRLSSWLAGSVANDHPLAIGASSTGKVPAQDTMLDDVMIYSVRLPAGYVSDVHECHVETAAALSAGDVGIVGTPAGDRACMGDYDDALVCTPRVRGRPVGFLGRGKRRHGARGHGVYIARCRTHGGVVRTVENEIFSYRNRQDMSKLCSNF